jgi:hypothetical protein
VGLIKNKSNMSDVELPEHRVFYEGLVRSFQYTLEVTAMCTTYSAHSGRDTFGPADVLLANSFFCPVFARALETRDPSYADDTLEMIFERAHTHAAPPTTGFRSSPDAFVASTCRCTVCAGMNAADPTYRPSTPFETLLWAVVTAPQDDFDVAPQEVVTPDSMGRQFDQLADIVARHLCPGGVAPFYLRFVE